MMNKSKILGLTGLLTLCASLAGVNRAEAYNITIAPPPKNSSLWVSGPLPGGSVTNDTDVPTSTDIEVVFQPGSSITIGDTGFFESDESYHVNFKGTGARGLMTLFF